MPSPFLAAAAAAGIHCTDGLVMLVAQALATFEIWFRDGHPFPRDEHTNLMQGLLAHIRGDR
jgi:shikimate 5-dehydrogenase